MVYQVRITKTLEGYAAIEADSIDGALKIAENRYNTNGEELPDMDDTVPLVFNAKPEDEAGEMIYNLIEEMEEDLRFVSSRQGVLGEDVKLEDEIEILKTIERTRDKNLVMKIYNSTDGEYSQDLIDLCGDILDGLGG